MFEHFEGLALKELKKLHCVKSVRIRSYSGPYLPALGLNAERYRLALRVQTFIMEQFVEMLTAVARKIKERKYNTGIDNKKNKK